MEFFQTNLLLLNLLSFFVLHTDAMSQVFAYAQTTHTDLNSYLFQEQSEGLHQLHRARWLAIYEAL